MKISIDLNDKHEETTIVIQAKEWSAEVESLIKQLNSTVTKRILGVSEEQSILLDPTEIDFVYAEKRKVFAATTSKQNIEVKMKLYEIEEVLKYQRFTRFSKSVIGNVEHIKRFELAFNGNLLIHFKSGNKEYVNRSMLQR